MTDDKIPEAQFTTNEEDQREAANLQARLQEKPRRILHSAAATRLPAVEIATGTHKYVLLRAKFNGQREYIVTSREGAPYHRNVAVPMVEKLEEAGYTDIGITGGGRISLDPVAQRIEIFGFSYSFGKADHAISHHMILEDERYKDYEVTITNEGY